MYEEENQYIEVMPLVQSLPSKYRTVIHLFYFEDMSVAEIAKTLNIKTVTIKSQLSRGRQILRNKLKGGIENV